MEKATSTEKDSMTKSKDKNEFSPVKLIVSNPGIDQECFYTKMIV